MKLIAKYCNEMRSSLIVDVVYLCCNSDSLSFILCFISTLRCLPVAILSDFILSLQFYSVYRLFNNCMYAVAIICSPMMTILVVVFFLYGLNIRFEYICICTAVYCSVDVLSIFEQTEYNRFVILKLHFNAGTTLHRYRNMNMKY